MGAVGGPKWASAARDKRPEAGLLGLRAGMNVFANLRPALCFAPLADASSLKRHLVEGLDLMIVRELTGGIYFGSPRFIEDLPAAGGAPSTPRSTPPPRSSASPASPSSSPAAGATR
jgi:3-isopropylmalate dehydrogenase